MRETYLAELTTALQAQAKPDRAAQEQRYLKSSDAFLGVSVPAGQAIARNFKRAHADVDYDMIRQIAIGLWSGTYHEERRLAIQLMHLHDRSMVADDWTLLAGWAREAGSWDLIDEISAHLLGHLMVAWPHLQDHFDIWVHDENFWVRRAALVSHVIPIRHRTVPTARVLQLCDFLMTDREYFVQKALGWVLRECAVQDSTETLAFLQPWIGRVPRMILREAVRKLDADQQRSILG